jgi:hypothetical protein
MNNGTKGAGDRPTWQAVKRRLRDLDANSLVELIRDLYESSPENQRFLHSRLVDSTSKLEKYRKLISEAIFPDPFHNKPVRVAEAKRLIRHYERATGDVGGTIDLLLTFVAAGTEQAADLGYGDEAYFRALVRALEAAVKMLPDLGADELAKASEELTWIRNRSRDIGWGFGDAVDDLTAAVLESNAVHPAKLRRPRSITYEVPGCQGHRLPLTKRRSP